MEDYIVINEKRFDLIPLLKNGAFCTTISVDESDINAIDSEFESQIITTETFVDDGPILFYRQNGKFTIIAGKLTAAKERARVKYKGVLVGKLISKVVLKKYSLEETVLQ